MRALIKKISNPIGSVIQSFLTEAQFQNEYGTNWVLCDGRDVTSSAYHSITGNTLIPDIRGKFLRAKDHGVGNNPDGDLAIASAQGQATRKNGLSASSNSLGAHEHFVSRNVIANTSLNSGNALAYQANSATASGDFKYDFKGYAGNGNIGRSSSSGSHSHTITVNNGDNETRPVNTTVNMFIKIN